MVDELRQDVRISLRGLRAHAAVAIGAIAILAVGIGANTAIFQVLDALTLRALPVRDPDTLVVLSVLREGKRTSMSYPMFKDIYARQDALAGVFASYDFTAESVAVPSAEPQLGVNVRLVTGGYFGVLGIAATSGRALTDQDDQPSAAPVAMISERFWKRAFGARPEAVGAGVRVNGLDTTVVGVTPAWFFGEQVGSAPDVWLPMSQASRLSFAWMTQAGAAVISPMGRLKADRPVAAAGAALDALFQGLVQTHHLGGQTAGGKLILESGERGRNNLNVQLSRPFWLLFGLVGLVLFIGCCSIACLLMARSASRRQELQIRLALGATRFRVVKQLLTESGLLAVAGGILGFFIAQWASTRLVTLFVPAKHVHVASDLNWHVVAVLIGISALTVLVFGVVPAYQATGLRGRNTLLSRQTVAVGGQAFTFVSRAFVVLQITVSLTLVAGAFLLGRSFWNLARQDLGFRPESVVAVRLPFSPASLVLVKNPVAREELYRKMSSIPGVRSAALVGTGPLDTMQKIGRISRPDRPAVAGESARFVSVTPAYFETMGIAIVRGRALTADDRFGGGRVAVLSETAVRQLFSGQDPIGQLFTNGERFDASRAIEIVGVAKDIRFSSPKEPFGMVVFQSMDQAPSPLTSVVLRTAVEPRSVIKAAFETVKSAAPGMAVSEVLPLSDQLDQTTAKDRTMALLSSGFGLLGLLLASLGLYGVMTLGIRQRTVEIGLRIALGAHPQQIRRRFMQELLMLLSAGLALGTVGTWLLGRSVEPLLFELRAMDPVLLASSAAVLVGVVLVAGFIAVHRATSLDPALALRGGDGLGAA